MNGQLNRDLWTIEAVMRKLSCSKTTVYDLVAKHKLDLVKLQRSSRITEESLQRYMNELHATKPTIKPRKSPRRKEGDDT